MLELLKNNIILWLLIAISITSLGLILEKILIFWRIKGTAEDEKLSRSIANLINKASAAIKIKGKSKTEANFNSAQQAISEARVMCLKEEPHVLSADTIRYVLDNTAISYRFLQEYAMREIERKLIILEKHIFLLGTFSAIAPLLGLLGTVLGMMIAFASFTSGADAEGALLSRGIAQALITTAAGLIIAIPNLFFYNYFARKIDVYRTALSLSISEVIEALKKNNEK